MPINTTTETFKADVLDASLPTVVDFWAEWCGPCRMIAPVLEEIEAEYGDKVRIVKVNVDDNPQLAMDYNVTGIPLLGVFQGGQLVKQLVGAKPKVKLVEELAEFLR